MTNNNTFHITVQKQWDEKTIEELVTNLWQLPKKMIHQFRTEKSILVNGKVGDFAQKIHVGDRLTLPLLQDRCQKPSPFPIHVDILYEDDHLLIVNKPAGMKTHPNHPQEENTLINAVAYTIRKREKDVSLSHIHRLDQDTSGTVLFAKHSISKVILDRMLEERKIHRTYVAFVHGKMKRKKGTIKAKIGRDRHHPTRRRVSSTGKEAITHFSVIRYDSQKDITEIACHLDTGRTHQIRVHLSYIGHPLVGDRLYGGKNVLDRHALHASQIEFIHPFTLKKIHIQAPYLDGMDQLK
ncbi:RluA family pseudouridine synthase [Fervidibacillus halotolerans]|uniref:Pseudouridine synthase n=1 Tax=Fervidibacillus halotolerans TaxID=2980027 RepID=A0A9E8M0Z1_9BACI|nr:RluA family pseudouridine synthase [Fervidibacillus halotolerans]WAA12967.1 RluA family pseudouridine synthase [Fervidibacillus halotolerans]